ncbi:MAG: DUF1801 domain-containing protein [Actinomycetes bacterium]
MTTVNFQAVFKKFPKEQQKALLATIAAAEALFPRAERAIAWGMPTLKIGDDNLCHVMGFKSHNSLFPASGSIAEHLEKELANYSISKGTIQFGLDKPFPKPLLKKILLTRLEQINASYPKKSGIFIEYYKNGGVKAEGKYKGSKINGLWKFYRIDGSVMRTGSFKDGEQSGTWTTYAANGRVVKVTKF